MTPQALDPAYSSGLQHPSTFGCMPSPQRPYVPMNDLARLIHRRKDELGLSWYDIADRGSFSSHTIVYSLAKKKVHRQPPRAETLTRLARALEIDVDIVRAAAASAAGYDMSKGTPTTLEVAEDLRVIGQALENMSPADRAKVRRIALSFLEDEVTLADETDSVNAASPDEADEATLRADLAQTVKELPAVRSISAKRPPKRR